MGTDVNIINTEAATIIKWAAVCSNNELLVEELKDKTDELVKYLDDIITPGTAQNISNTLISFIRTIFINRKYDVKFLDMLIETGHKELQTGAIDTLIDIGSESLDITPEPYFDSYISKYGRDRNILMIMLKWYTMPTNYSKNVEKVNTILNELD